MAIALPVLDGLLSIGGKLIDRLIPDKVAQDAAKLKLVELAQTGALAELDAEVKLAVGQLEINKVEAASQSLFVSGWRPGVGWICVAGLASQFVIGPLVEWISALMGERVTWPIANGPELFALLSGILGIGGLRTTEKIKGVANK